MDVDATIGFRGSRSFLSIERTVPSDIRTLSRAVPNAVTSSKFIEAIAAGSVKVSTCAAAGRSSFRLKRKGNQRPDPCTISSCLPIATAKSATASSSN